MHELAEALGQRGPFVTPLDLGAGPQDREVVEPMLDRIETALEAGQLIVVEGAFPLLGVAPEFELTAKEVSDPIEPPLPAIAQPRAPSKLTFFEVRFVDEIGEAIGGLEVELKAGTVIEQVNTNPAGVAMLEDVTSMSGSVSVVDIAALGAIVEPRFQRERVGRPPSGVNTQLFRFTGAEIVNVNLKPAVPNTVVIAPEFGKLFAELWDKLGAIRHVEAAYSISGPKVVSGKTDDQGRLLHEGMPAGDYELTLKVDIERVLREAAPDATLAPDIREFRSPLVVLESTDPEPEVRLVGGYRSVELARVRGMLFDTNKSFILNGAIRDMKKIRAVYERNNPSELLIVGHTDTTAQPDINDPLSVERAESVRAYLEDDVDAWLGKFGEHQPVSKRWGDREILQMIEALPDAETRDAEQEPIRWFQARRRLKVDGIAGEQTRRQLIFEYMRLDGTTLKDNPDFDIRITTHGCGENFPLDETGEALDEAALNEQEDQLDRRVELLFFDREFGIDPPPPGRNSPKGSTQYLQWRKRAKAAEDLRATEESVLEVHLHDENHEPMPEAVCEVLFGASTLLLNADDRGVIKLTLPAGHPDTVVLNWGESGSDERPFSRQLLVESNRGSKDQIARARLHNLGYPVLVDPEIALAAFQRDYRLAREPFGDNDEIPEATRAELDAIWNDRVCNAEFPE
ncbi:MAG TPA: OmpA family protein [Polyangiaceae bacterium]